MTKFDKFFLSLILLLSIWAIFYGMWWIKQPTKVIPQTGIGIWTGKGWEPEVSITPTPAPLPTKQCLKFADGKCN